MLIKNHSHDVSIEEIEGLEALSKVKNRAIETTEKSSDIIIENLRLMKDNELIMLPKISSIKDNIRRIRNKKMVGQDNLILQDIPEILKRDKDGNNYIRFDTSIDDPDRILIMCSEQKLKYIKKSQIMLLDGTFKIAPNNYYQLFTIHFYILGRSFPFIYCLMKNKKEESYIKLFKKCIELFEINPKNIISDFEKSIYNAVKKVR